MYRWNDGSWEPVAMWGLNIWTPHSSVSVLSLNYPYFFTYMPHESICLLNRLVSSCYYSNICSSVLRSSVIFQQEPGTVAFANGWGYCWIEHLLHWHCSLCICVPHTTACVIPAIKSLPKKCVNIYFSSIVGCFPTLSFFALVIRNFPVLKFLSLWSHSYSQYSQFCCASVCLSIGIVGPRLTFCIKGAVLAPDSQTWEVCRGFPSSVGKLQSPPQALSS